MSITVVFVTPVLLTNVITPVIAPLATSLIAGGACTLKTTMDILEDKKLEKEREVNISYNCKIIKELMKKELKTTIVDKNLLMKTLKEHGAYIMEEKNDYILCSIEDFTLKFTKNPEMELEPYYLTIEYRNGENKLDNLIENISNEYIQNVQEYSYNKIKKRIEENHLTIDEEEVYDDDTIVLTINLE